MTGYILAFVSSLFFSLYIIPRKLTKLHPVLFSMLMGLGFSVGSIVLYLIALAFGVHETISWPLLWSVGAGVIWAIGFVVFVKAIDGIGLARSNQWKNLQGPTGVLLSLVILGEASKADPMYTLLAGMAVFLSALCFTIAGSTERKKERLQSVYMALMSGVAFGSVAVINKYVTTEVGVYTQQVVWSIAIFASLALYVALQRQYAGQVRHIARRDGAMGLLAGIVYLGASYFMLESYRHIPASIGFTIVQLNGVWTILIGLIIFKEIDIKQHWKRIGLGFLLALLGVALLALAKR